MTVCTQCGAENTPDARTCSGCGQPLLEKVDDGPLGDLPPGPITVGSEPISILPSGPVSVSHITPEVPTPAELVALPPSDAAIVAPIPVSIPPTPVQDKAVVTNNSATVALVFGLVSVFCGLGVIFGPIAISQANKALCNPDADTGTANIARTLGIAGTILGAINVLFALAVLFFIAIPHR